VRGHVEGADGGARGADEHLAQQKEEGRHEANGGRRGEVGGEETDGLVCRRTKGAFGYLRG